MSVWPSVGMKCICVSNGAGTAASVTGVRYPLSIWGIENAVKGAQYTVREVVDTLYGIGLLIEEIDNRHVRTVTGDEVSFLLSRFRPLITRTKDEDVAAFKSLLQDMPLTKRLDRIGELLG